MSRRYIGILAAVGVLYAAILADKLLNAPRRPEPPLPTVTVTAPEPTEYLPELTPAMETATGWSYDIPETPAKPNALWAEPVATPVPLPQDEIMAIARTITFEVVEGNSQEAVAVAWVIINRVEDK
ncbi:MAG: hypothetical protein LBN43_03245, partial [Oscillospiraceae bacterium]|nr:hypothetical protein [Oscillospiraceae bacterium]